MFAQGTPTPNFSVGPGSKNYSAKNSGNRFLEDLSLRGANILNQSFDTAEKNYRKQFKQTTLYESQSFKRPKLERLSSNSNMHINLNSSSSKMGPNHPTLNVTNKIDYFLLPVPQPNNQNSHRENISKRASSGNPGTNKANTMPNIQKKDEDEDFETFMNSNGRDLRRLWGQVDFAVEMNKKYPAVNAIWEVVGKLINMLNGKFRNEKILFLRNENTGPVMRAVYFDVRDECKDIPIGSNVRAVGRLSEGRSMKCYRVDKIEDEELIGANFTRSNNVISFTLAQIKQKK